MGDDVRRVGRVDQLEVAAHDGDRGAQFVADVVEKLALVPDGALNSVEHPVDGAGEGRELVAAADRDPGGEVEFVDRVDRAAQFLDRPEQSADERPGDQRDEGEQHAGDDRVDEHGAAQRLHHRPHVVGVDERPLRGAELDRSDQHAIAPLIRRDAGDHHLVSDGVRADRLDQLGIVLEAKRGHPFWDERHPVAGEDDLALGLADHGALHEGLQQVGGLRERFACLRIDALVGQHPQLVADAHQPLIDARLDVAALDHRDDGPRRDQGEPGEQDHRHHDPGAEARLCRLLTLRGHGTILPAARAAQSRPLSSMAAMVADPTEPRMRDF